MTSTLVRDSQAANATQNLVRKSLYFNYDHYKAIGKHAFENKGDVFQRHVSKLFESSLKGALLMATAHCLDAIRQVLMCNVDTAVLGQVWANKDDPIAFPDFNTRHMCKNYEAVREWAEKLQVRIPRYAVDKSMLILASGAS